MIGAQVGWVGRALITAVRFVLLLVAGIALVNGPAGAIMRAVPLEELAVGAESIVEGTVVSKTSFWSDDGRTIFTDVVIEGTGSLKGKAPETFVVRVEGGEVGDLGIWVEHAPRFTPRESVLLFLEPAGPSGVRTVLDMEQGKYTVAGNSLVDSGGRVAQKSDFVRDLQQHISVNPD